MLFSFFCTLRSKGLPSWFRRYFLYLNLMKANVKVFYVRIFNSKVQRVNPEENKKEMI
jgi:hypothetical protein